METIGGTWQQYTVGYYLFAILFLIFDVEAVFVFPWAVVMREVGMAAFVEILIFFSVLGLGLLYAWKKHALKWE
jgi:NADH-quinone oxidoreductase subunit A